MSYKKSTVKSLDELKLHLKFVDETFTISSGMRKRTTIKNAEIIESIFLTKAARKEIENEKRAIRRKRGTARWDEPKDDRYRHLENVLREANKRISYMIGIYRYVYPLSPKTVLQYEQEMHELLANEIAKLPYSEQRQVKLFHEGKLIEYSREVIPKGVVQLDTSLSPYYSNEKLTIAQIKNRLESAKVKIHSAILNAAKNGQAQRRKRAEYKLRKAEHALSLIARLDRKVVLYGRYLKGVKSFVILDGKTYNWPKYLIGNFKEARTYVASFNAMLISKHSVVIPSSGEVPVIATEAIHLFCSEPSKTLEAINLMSEYEYKKFRPFSHYEVRMSEQYPLKNSIAFPYFYPAKRS